MDHILLNFFIFFCYFTSSIIAQQEYSGNSVLNCSMGDETGPSSSFLYTCNGENWSCRAFLIFKSQPPYNSVLMISKLTSSVPSELATINNVSRLTIFPMGKEVIVPVNCSCSGLYYQAISSYVIPTRQDTYFTIASYTYQGLSTCSSLIDENSFSETDLLPGFQLRVPLRCACPTSTQIANGTKYLLTYSIFLGDGVTVLSKRFNVTRKNILDANGFTDVHPTIFPFTTILIPMPTEPSSFQTITHVLPTPSPPYKKLKKGLHLGVGIAISSSVLVLICVFVGIIFLYHKKKHLALKGKKNWVLPDTLLVGIAKADRVLKVFLFEDLKLATNNFNSGFKIKGSVFRGVLYGEVVAIKKMNTNIWKEAKLLNKINHFNLIRLQGVCENNRYSYLVYEYMEYGCLRDWLCNKNCSAVQSWIQRVQIALDVANGLHYLHNFTNPAYVHKDIKSSNVLLNGNLRAKIANFGLATSTEGRTDGFISTKYVGTRGYMAPEYLETGLVTPTMDVYAFGVVMLELITGNNVVMMHEGKESLLSVVIVSIMEGEYMEAALCKIMDANLSENYPMDLALAVAKLSVACLKRDPTSRPSMDEVVSTLMRIQKDSLNRLESSQVESV